MNASPDNKFASLLGAHGQRGIASVCSAHPYAIRAAALEAQENNGLLLIEATCNQVNQDGGYTGMRPADFRAFVEKLTPDIAPEKLLLGGDHLGPHVWRRLSAEDAMTKAEAMVGQYAAAGFGKIYLDTSMPCGSDPAVLPDEIVAARAARLAKVAESEGDAPLYIIGTEVPVPGGASQGHELAVTTPQAAAQTLAVHRKAFAVAGLESAWSRVVGLVVQPGVEFDNEAVVDYAPAKAKALADWRRTNGVLFEAHSTDYQRPQAYRDLVADGFAILKVGPGVTFALREAVAALAAIEAETIAADLRSRVIETILAAMRANPVHWRDYYSGPDQDLLMLNSYSDRVRYYWPDPKIDAAVKTLIANLTARPAPDILLSRHLPAQYKRVRSGVLARDPQSLVLDKIRDALRPYSAACRA